MQKNQQYKYEERYIKTLLNTLIEEDKKRERFGQVKKNDYLKNGVKACKNLNKKLNRPTFDR